MKHLGVLCVLGLLAASNALAAPLPFGMATLDHVVVGRVSAADLSLTVSAKRGDILRVDVSCGASPPSVGVAGVRPAVEGAATPLAEVPFIPAGQISYTAATSISLWRVTADGPLTITVDSQSKADFGPCTVLAYPVAKDAVAP